MCAGVWCRQTRLRAARDFGSEHAHARNNSCACAANWCENVLPGVVRSLKIGYADAAQVIILLYDVSSNKFKEGVGEIVTKCALAYSGWIAASGGGVGGAKSNWFYYIYAQPQICGKRLRIENWIWLEAFVSRFASRALMMKPLLSICSVRKLTTADV